METRDTLETFRDSWRLVEISRDTLERLEILISDHWLLCKEIATARQVGPRNDTMSRVPTDD